MKPFIPALLALAVIACAVGPDYQAPETQPARITALEAGDWSSQSDSRLLLPGTISIAREIIESWAYSG